MDVVTITFVTASTALVSAALGGTGYLFAIARLRRVLRLGG